NCRRGKVSIRDSPQRSRRAQRGRGRELIGKWLSMKGAGERSKGQRIRKREAVGVAISGPSPVALSDSPPPFSAPSAPSAVNPSHYARSEDALGDLGVRFRPSRRAARPP